MRRDIAVMLGGTHYNANACKKFRERGYKIVVVDWNEQPELRGDKHYQLDIKDSEAILAALERDGLLPRVAGAFSSSDVAVGSVIAVNGAAGLLTPPPDIVPMVTRKSRMTARWRELGLLNRWSQVYERFDGEIAAINRRMALIVKPDDEASSAGITIVPQGSGAAALQAAFGKAQGRASDNAVVVEEFLRAQEFVVDMLGDSQGHVAVYGVGDKAHSPYSPANKVTVGTHYNPVEHDGLQREIADYAVRCYKALGLCASCANFEILRKADGALSPVELGARSSGFIFSDFMDAVTGRSYIFDWVDVLRGGTVTDGLLPQTGLSAGYYFYDFPAGTVIRRGASIMDFMDKRMETRYSDHENLVPGHVWEAFEDDRSRVSFEAL